MPLSQRPGHARIDEPVAIDLKRSNAAVFLSNNSQYKIWSHGVSFALSCGPVFPVKMVGVGGFER